MYYSIDDQHGTNICSGIQLEHKARETAQEYANDLGAPVLLYSSDGEEETIEPDGGEPSESDREAANTFARLTVPLIDDSDEGETIEPEES